MPDRQFSVRYASWTPIVATVPAKVLPADATPEQVVRRAMGYAFHDKLQGDWKDGDDLKVVIQKANPGVYSGVRQRPKSGKKDEPFYVLEL